MSTQYSSYAPASVVERSTDGNREFQSARSDQVPRTNWPTRIPSLDSPDGASISNAEPTVRRPLNDFRTLQPADVAQNANRMSSGATARDLMKVCTATLHPEDSIERAARLMSETDSGAVPVVDGSGRLIGIISDRDIAVKLVAPGASIPHAQVSDCMSNEAFACSADNSLESCVTAMSWHQMSRVPIVDDEHRALGTISQKDIARYLCEHPDKVDRLELADILWTLAS